MSLTIDQKITMARKKLSSLGSVIKSINEAGRSALSEPATNSYFFGMFRSIDSTYDKFNKVWDDLAELHLIKGAEEFPSSTEEAIQQNVSRYYYEACGAYEQCTRLSSNPQSQATALTTIQNLSSANPRRSRLPKINLPSFDGTVSEWPFFRDTFISLVHSDESIPDIDKFHFLIGSLRGSALSEIKNISICETHYQQAWTKLLKRFNNKRKLATAYLHTLFNFKPLQGKPTEQSLLAFLSTISETITSFKSINIPNLSEYILFELAVRCLDPYTRQAFEFEFHDTDFPTFQELVTFVEARAEALGKCSTSLSIPTTSGKNISAQLRHPTPNRVSSKPSSQALFAQSLGCGSTSKSTTSEVHPNTYTSRVSRLPTCFVCSDRHSLTQCPKFKSSSPSQRLQLLNNWTGCRNCLYPGHSTRSCSSKWNCRECGARHHTSLHLPKSSTAGAAFKSIGTNKSPTQPSQSTVLNEPKDLSSSTSLATTSQHGITVLLGTAVAQIPDCKGAFHDIRLVIDCGSQHSFITEGCVTMLGLTPRKLNQTISGVGNILLDKVSGKVLCSLSPLHDRSPTIETEAVVVPTITPPLPQKTVPDVIVSQCKRYALADPHFFQPGPIDMLLGADVFPQVISGLPLSLGADCPHVLPTIFGSVIMGKLTNGEEGTPSNAVSFLGIDVGKGMDDMMNKFWAIEEIAAPQICSPLDVKCDEHFQKTHYRLPTGRYVVSLPFKVDNPELPSLKQKALLRLFHLESKLGKSPNLFQSYHSFLKEYEQLGHMYKTSVPAKYIIPHHAVLKENNCAKLRVVFDGSATTSKGSLNDQLLVGPKLQKDIGDILLNFRRYPIAFSTDIVKMYRQILINDSDRAYQHILWRFDRDSPVEEYELATVTYGLTCSPYLALRVIHQLVIDEGAAYPSASKRLLNDIYVDDVVTGTYTISEAIDLKTQLIALLAKGGFSLSKWASNRHELLPQSNSDTITDPVSLTPKDDPSVKVLGLQWDTNHDVFAYKIHLPSFTIITKRAVLSTIARLYDPLGYLSPSIFYAKVILQDTWRAGIDWDTPVPQSIEKRWLAFITDLSTLGKVNIPRYVLDSQTTDYQILGFCDASQKGYCATIYLRKASEPSSGLTLLKAKTKLAPVKSMTIPRLELCGALLLARLYTSMLPFLKEVGTETIILFTDSSVVLGWLRTSPHLLKPFVAHRIIEITDSTDVTWWRHINTSDNPADCGSRGLLPTQLLANQLWWNGPPWIRRPESQWPSSYPKPCLPSTLPELKGHTIALATVAKIENDLLEWMEKFSSYCKLVRSLAYVLRFLINTQSSSPQRYTGPINALEFRRANLKCIYLLQRQYYPESYGEQRPQSALLQNLNAFVDPVGILRVGGRIQNSALSDQQKHPILLPRRSHFTTLIVDFYHRTYGHVGPSTLQAFIQQAYWIPAARSLIKQRKLKCLTCFKVAKHPQPPYMGNLPPSRFAEVRPFIHTGVDFAGPFLSKESSRRKAPTTKSYLCLFVCLSTKAVHLEVAPSLSTEAFLDALERFVSRRGTPARIFSDCGTNFVGADRYLREVTHWLQAESTKNNIIQNTATKGIEWQFNPPHSPHFGGLWEAGVKATKNIIIKAFGNHPFTERELSTIFAKVEGILNSRPLTPLSTDPSDLQTLTPGHFLIGQPLTSIPEHDLTEVPEQRLSRWQLIRQRIQSFWERWRKEYLQTLQKRNKWTATSHNLQVGDMVLLKESNLPTLQWPLARVVNIHPGKDNIVRVVTIRTATGTYKRPVVSLVSLSAITNPL